MSVDYAPSYFDILEFADTIQSRMAFDVFKRVQIRFLPPRVAESFNPATLPRLRQLRDIGLDISVPYGGKDLL
jgi:hypothetical protein